MNHRCKNCGASYPSEELILNRLENETISCSSCGGSDFSLIPPEGMWFILDDEKNVIPADSYETIEKWLHGRKNRGVRFTKIRTHRNVRIRLSTVFLCLESVGGMFETMFFPITEGVNNYESGILVGRRETYWESVKLHNTTKRQLKKGMFPDEPFPYDV